MEEVINDILPEDENGYQNDEGSQLEGTEFTADPLEEESEEQVEEPEKKGGFSKRIDKLTQQKYEAMLLAEEKAKEAEYWKAQAQVQKAPVTDSKPTIDQFYDAPDPQEAFMEALVDWKTEKKLHETFVRREQETQQNSVVQSYQKQVTDAKGKYDDYDEVVYNPAVPITNAMASSIMESDVGAEVAYYLASNINEAKRIAAMSQMKQVKEIGRIEEKLSQPSKRTTNAPSPVRTVAGKSESSSKNYEKMDYAEYAASRRKR